MSFLCSQNLHLDVDFYVGISFVSIAVMTLAIAVTIGTMSFGEPSFVSSIDDRKRAQAMGFATRLAGGERGRDRTPGHIQCHRTQGRGVAEHVGVRSIGQRTVALSGFDAAAQLIGLGRCPH